MVKKIPKVIHYCWFGHNAKTEIIEKCINSWKEKCPDYEIKEWNESNFNVQINDYVKEAYELKKWAFVTDYVRLYVIYNYGGIYLDTDVELLKNLDSLIEKYEAFYSCENEKYIATGLGFGSYAGNDVIKNMMEEYHDIHFKNSDGTLNLMACPIRNTNNFRLYTNIDYDFDGVVNFGKSVILPSEYFCPLNYETGQINMTENTYAIHHYAGTWLSEREQKYLHLQHKLSGVFGIKIGKKITNICKMPYEIKNDGIKFFLQNKIKKIGR